MTNGKLLTLSDRNGLDISYTGLQQYENFLDRLNYLSLYNLGYDSPRDIGHWFYNQREWRDLREEIIARDLGYDIGCSGVNIYGRVLVHHIKPILEEDLENWNVDILLNPDNLITVSYDTHNKIHYGEQVSNTVYVERSPGDTKLW